MWLELPALLAGVAVTAATHGRVALAAPVLFAWMSAPVVIGWLCRPVKSVDPASRLSADDRRLLRSTARKTWHFFETFVTAEDHWLPPDNFQEEPRGVVAHRTSPTNIGLYLLAVGAARDFGYITARALVRRIRDTLDTLDRLDRTEGHILNWYDTKTLRPLEPRYVSTVDSGNLAAYLWTIRQLCAELVDRPIVGPEAIDGVADAFALAGIETPEAPALDLRGTLARLDAWPAPAAGAAKDDWYERAESTRKGWLEEVEMLAPHLAWMSRTPATVANRSTFAELRVALESRASLPRSPREVLRRPTRHASMPSRPTTRTAPGSTGWPTGSKLPRARAVAWWTIFVDSENAPTSSPMR
jgi:hypothetical protein